MISPLSFSPPALEKKTAHIWCFNISDYHSYAHERLSILTEEEREKANRFYKEEDQLRCRVVYVLLREILSIYSGVKEELIEIDRTEKGKPFMKGKSALFFNLSHSGDKVLFGFSSREEIGVDIEKEKPCRDLDGLIGACCSEGEKNLLSVLSGKEKEQLFYRFWSLKEAYLKGIGKGITVTLKNVDFSENNQIEDWKMTVLENWTGYSAAVALMGNTSNLLLIT